MWGRYCSEQRQHLCAIICGSRTTRNAELDINWSGELGTTAVVALAVQRPPLQLIFIKLCVAHQPYVLRYIGLDCITSLGISDRGGQPVVQGS